LDWFETQPTISLRNVVNKEGKEEIKQWEEIERKARFYSQEEETMTEAWDVREATREMKDMDID